MRRDRMKTTRQLPHIRMKQSEWEYQTLNKPDYQSVVILGTGDNMKAFAKEGIVNDLGEVVEVDPYDPFFVSTREELLRIAGEGSAYDLYCSMAEPFGECGVYVMIAQEDELAISLKILENIEFKILLVDDMIRVDKDLTLTREGFVDGQPTQTKMHPIIWLAEIAKDHLSYGELVHIITSVEIKDIHDEKEMNRLRERIDRITAITTYNNKIRHGRMFSFIYDTLKYEHATALYLALYLEQGIPESPVNEFIGNPTLGKSLTDYEYQVLENQGIISLMLSYHKGTVFASSTVGVTETYPYIGKSLAHQKTVQYVISLVTRNLEDLIGESIDSTMYRNVELAFKIMYTHLLRKLYVRDVSFSYRFEDNYLLVDVKIVPIGSIHAIDITIQTRVVYINE